MRAPFRSVLAALPAWLAWLATGGCWVAVLTLPFAGAGTLSLSTFADALTLVRGGGVDEALPVSPALVVVLALAVPVVGLLLVALAGVRGVAVLVVRAVLAAAGVTAVVVAATAVPQDDAGLGVGGRVAVAGCVLAGAALVLEVLHALLRRRPGAAAPGRPQLVLTVAALVLAVVGAGHVAWQATRHPGGAPDPETAARDLVQAVVERDGVAVLGVVAPEEVGTVVDRFLALRDRTGGGDGPGLTDAVTIDVSDVEVEVERQSSFRSRVTVVDGRYRVGLDVDALPGPLARLDLLFPDGDWRGTLDDVSDSPLSLFLDERLSLTTQEVDGRWYVTGVGTAVDHVSGVLLGDDLATPDPDRLTDLLLDRLGGMLGDLLGAGLGALVPE